MVIPAKELKEYWSPLDEAGWTVCTKLDRFLITADNQGLLSDRKGRLFVVACCRQVWGWRGEAPNREELEVGERFADGLATLQELQAAAASFLSRHMYRWAKEWPLFSSQGLDYHAIRSPIILNESELNPTDHAETEHLSILSRLSRTIFPRRSRKTIDKNLARQRTANMFVGVGGLAHSAMELGLSPSLDTTQREAELKKRQGLLIDYARDLFGPLPFRNVAVDPDWLLWNEGAVRKLAESIYQDRNFHGMPILADALEDAGCTNADILDHCRTHASHIRGCWVLDLLLGKS